MPAPRRRKACRCRLLLARSGDLRAAISIDQVLGSREIVVKPVGPQVNSVPGIFGATIMGDGRVVVILDVAPLVRRQAAIVRDATPQVAAPAVVAHVVPVVMVVDDSITMRKVTGRVLERNNMEVLTAKDGVDAVEKMAERVPTWCCSTSRCRAWTATKSRRT
jgi:chemosensory pili system protein ChpA (sensor histidine kinase/response regulator)